MADSKKVDFLGAASGPDGDGGILAKATITPLAIYLGDDPNHSPPQELGPITVLFNPKEYTIEKSINWKFHGTAGSSSELVEYTGGDSEVLTVELFADTSRDAIDVQAFTDQIRELTYPDEDLGHPRVVRFDWGEFSFRGFIMRLTQKFTHHLRDGTPVRATLNLSIKDVSETLNRSLPENDPSLPDHTWERPDPSVPDPSEPEDSEPEDSEPEDSESEDNEPEGEDPWIKLRVIGPGANLSAQEWVCYHHGIFFIEMTTHCIEKVELSITPNPGPAMNCYITGIWKQSAAGSVEPKDGHFDSGGVGRWEAHHTGNSKRCYFWEKFGTKYGTQGHPNNDRDNNVIYPVINTGKVTFNFKGHDRWVIVIYPRKAGTYTLQARGLPPFPCTEATPEVKASTNYTMTTHSHQGD